MDYTVISWSPGHTRKRQHPGYMTAVPPVCKQRVVTQQAKPPCKWSTQEDDLVQAYVDKVGGKENVNWRKCSENLQQQTQIYRSANACRNRFNVYLSHKTQLINQLPLTKVTSVNNAPTAPIFKPMNLAPAAVTPLVSRADRRTLTSTTRCPPQSVTCGIQTDVTFAPSDKVEWASTSKQCTVEVCPETPMQSTQNVNPVHTPSLRSLLTSPLPQLSPPDVMATPQKTSTDFSRRLFMTPPTTPCHQLEPTTDDNRMDSLSMCDDGMPDVLANHLTTSPITLPDTSNDHTYMKEKKITPPKVKRQKKECPEVEALRQKLLLVDKTPVITLKHQACLSLGIKDVTSASSIAANVLSVPPVRDAIVNQLSEELAVRPDTMRNRKHGEVSVLMKKDFDDMQHIHLVDIVTEFVEKFPELFRLILGITNGCKDLDSETFRTLIPRLGMIYSIMMQTRIPTLSRLQRVLTMALADQICNQKVYDRLNVLGVTMSYPSSLDIMKVVGAHFKDQLFSAVKAGKHLRLIGDNLNFMQGVAYENIDHHKHMVHMFASCALITEPVYSEKSETPTIPLQDLNLNDITLSREEYAVMRADMVIMVADILSKYLPQLRALMECLPKQFSPEHPEFGRKTGVIPLPVLNLNEQYDSDTTKILEYYQGLVSELPRDSTEPIHIGGDQLTRERFGTALNLRIGNLPNGRFANLGPATFEFFHLGMNYLDKMVFDQLWSKEEELGTLRGERERIILKSVDPDVAKAYEADKLFFTNYVAAHLVEAALDFFGMESRNDFPTKNQPPADGSPEEMKAWVEESLGSIVDQYGFPYWNRLDKPAYVSVDEPGRDQLQAVIKLRSGKLHTLNIRQKGCTIKTVAPDKKKTYAHYVLEAGLTFAYFLRLCKRPDRPRLLGVFKLMMEQLKGRANNAKYPLELLNMLLQQYSLLSECRAHQVLHACFVNTKGRPDSNIPADLQMEWVVKQNKQHIRHMFSNKTIPNILVKSSALPGLHTIADNYDVDADVVVRAKAHKPKDIDRDEMQIMEDLRKVRPFQYTPGRAYRDRKFANLPTSQAKKLNSVKLQGWFKKHKDANRH